MLWYPLSTMGKSAGKTKYQNKTVGAEQFFVWIDNKFCFKY